MLSPTDWAWEALGLSGRQSALSTAAILPEHREGRTSPGFSGRGPGDAVAMALVDAPALPSPLYKLLPVAWDSGDPGLRAPGTRGFFSRPPPSLTA